MTPDQTTLRTELESRLRFETLIADLSSRFISLPAADVDGWMEDAQRRVCECLALDLSALWQWSGENPPFYTLTHLVRRAGGMPLPDSMDGREHFPWCVRQLKAGEVVVVSSVERLPPEAARDRDSWRRCGIKATLAIPLAAGGGPPIGALSFGDTRSERVWPDALVSRLELVAQLFTSALLRKRADPALLEQSEARYRSLVEMASDAVVVHRDGRYVYANRAALDLFGVTLETLLAASVLDFVDPTDRDALSERIRLGETRSAAAPADVVRIRRPNGDMRYVEGSGTTIMLDGLPSVMAVLRDVTDQRAAAAALKDRTDRLAMALTSAKLGAWDVKFSEMSIRWEDSQEDLFGDGPGKFPVRVSELVTHLHPDDREAVVETFMRLTREAGTRTVEVRLLWPDGSEHWHQVFARSEGAPGSAPTRMAGLSLDITDRKKREAELGAALDEVRRLRDQLRDENVYLRQEMKGLQSGLRIVGQSPAILRVLAQAKQVATTASTVLLVGETGTGKERFATAIHELSQRRDRPMVRVNCAAIPATLIESELFGREKGAYTGALSRQAGRFELAHGSSLFLDEVGDLPPEVQVKLLRVLQEKQIERLGSPKPVAVDVRIIAATNQNLEAAIAEGRFREDLYYRLNVFPILIPPLRERREDIPLLVAALVDELGAAMGKRIDAISKASLGALTAYSWPGNIRELRNVVERAMIVANGPVLEVEVPRPAEAVATAVVQGAKHAERRHILDVLQGTGWRIRGPHGAAQILGLKPTTLEHRMARLGIVRPGRS